jgi:DNA-binding transcriptional LysR family regulator
LWRQLQGGPASVVSIAADEMIAQTLFPIILAAVAPRAPGAGLELRTAPPAGVETWLRDRGADLAITVSDRRVTGVRSLRLARLGLRLLVGRKTKIDSAGHFWRQGAIAERLIYPSEADVVHRNFERGLRGLGVEWRAAIRVNSAAVMRELVASGQGVGVDVELPVAAHQRGIRAIPLTGFEPVPLVLLWREPVQPGLEPVLAAVRATAGKLWPAGP